ncbi:uncharacterized protein LOC144353415, partial [Saccoglossus kowalevskii]
MEDISSDTGDDMNNLETDVKYSMNKDDEIKNTSDDGNGNAVVDDKSVIGNDDAKMISDVLKDTSDDDNHGKTDDRSVYITDAEGIISDNDRDNEKLLNTKVDGCDDKIKSAVDKEKRNDVMEKSLDASHSDFSPIHLSSGSVDRVDSLNESCVLIDENKEKLSPSRGETVDDVKVGFLPTQNEPRTISDEQEEFTEIVLDDKGSEDEARKIRKGKYTQSMKLLIPIRAKKMDMHHTLCIELRIKIIGYLHYNQNLLMMEEYECFTTKPKNKNHAIEIVNATFAWDKQEQQNNDEKKESASKKEVKSNFNSEKVDVTMETTNASDKETMEMNEKDLNSENIVEVLFNINLTVMK